MRQKPVCSNLIGNLPGTKFRNGSNSNPSVRSDQGNMAAKIGCHTHGNVRLNKMRSGSEASRGLLVW